MKLSRGAYTLIGLLAAAATLGVAVYAAISQTFPATTIPPLNFTVTANCGSLTDESTPAPTTGTLIFNCASGSTGGVAAFTVNRDGTSTPTYTISTTGGTLTTSLSIAPDGSGCTSSVTTLTTGTTVHFSGSGAWI